MLGLEGKERDRERGRRAGDTHTHTHTHTQSQVQLREVKNQRQQERHSGDLGAGVGVARILGPPEVQGTWGREGVGTGHSLLQASPAGLSPRLGVAVEVLRVPRNRLGGPLLLPRQHSLGTLYLEAASPWGPLRAELGRPEVKLD